jgi:hypothetical protein
MSQPSLQKVRNLRVIRIDDTAGSLVPDDKYFPIEGDGVVRRPLDLVTYKVKDKIGLGINGLAAARMFWLQFKPAFVPDIVLGDINFEHDEGSPLQAWGREAKSSIPNGLMHCKPFAAMARVTGRPLSVMLHTADKGHWSRMLTGVGAQDDRRRVFALLAAQEAMEVAAILGDPIPGASRYNLDPVWEWLGDRTQSTPSAALKMAIVDYRRRLTVALRSKGENESVLRLRVGFYEWRLLLDWCQGMRNGPKVLKDEADIGLPLLYPDGSHDRISFASLFADVRDVTTKTLPATCFELIRIAEPWDLKNGLPQVGALIAECGEVGEATTAAGKSLRLLPLSLEPLQINIRRLLEDTLALGFAVLFRALEIYRSDEDRWERIWTEGHWHPGKLAEVEDASDYRWAKPVGQWVKLVERALRAVASEDGGVDLLAGGEEFVEVEAVAEKFAAMAPSEVRRDLTAVGVSRHLEFLCEMGLAESRISPSGGAVYRILGSQEKSEVPQRPVRPSAGSTCLNWSSDNLSVSLRDSLGFGSRGPGVNDNAIGQILHDAFVGGIEDSSPSANERAKSGREFLERFRSGDSPAWIQETCRSYCQEVLRWNDERYWPRCINQPSLKK